MKVPINATTRSFASALAVVALAVYVVSGHVESAVDDEAPIVYGPGDVWYESHMQLHRVFRNASDTEPFTAIVFAIRDPDHPANVAAADVDSVPDPTSSN